jgi:hypothetical protein
MIKTSKFGAKYVHQQIEHLALPFVTKALGQEVTVARFKIIKRDRIVAASLPAGHGFSRRLRETDGAFCRSLPQRH